MFREVVRKKQELSEADCIAILKHEVRGVLAVLGDDEYPYAVPTNYWYNKEDGKLYFHSGKSGHKIDAIKRHDKVSFCVYDSGTHKEGDWALTFKSVIVFGRIELVEDYDFAMDIARRLSLKFTFDTDYIEHEVANYGAGTLVFALVPEHITGKTIHEA
ncbi:MAG: pyridoxamine 5'-phosphate oxidase family protein [Oscillospiraceae bacterium]|nr:pyridoxamine 5'-phosphate oxidase family protein [Oscillospiraceae bacterium]